MAPKTRGASRGAAGMKRKRTVRRPAREPSPDSESSATRSESPPPASQDIDHLAGRAIATGRKIDFELFHAEGLLLGSQITEMGWEKFCSLDCPSYPALIKDFYKNLARGDSGLVSSVRNVKLNITVDILARLLSLPTSGPSTFTPEDRSPALSRLLNKEIVGFEEILANQLPLELRLLHNICSRVLFPKTGRFDYVSERDIFVMDSVVSAKPINLPCMILWYIAECGGKKKACLPYGMVLTLLFRSQGVPISDSEPKRDLRHTDYYSMATVQRMGFIKRNGRWERKNAAEDRDNPAAPGPSTIHSSPIPSPSIPTIPPSPPLPPPACFSDIQMDQLRSILAEHDSVRSNEIGQLRDEIRTLKEAMNSKLDLISSSINSSVESFSTNLHDIFERMEGITDKSGKYIHATNQLKKDIDLAVGQIEKCLEDFKKNQKEDIMDIIGHLKQIIFKRI